MPKVIIQVQTQYYHFFYISHLLLANVHIRMKSSCVTFSVFISKIDFDHGVSSKYVSFVYSLFIKIVQVSNGN